MLQLNYTLTLLGFLEMGLPILLRIEVQMSLTDTIPLLIRTEALTCFIFSDLGPFTPP